MVKYTLGLDLGTNSLGWAAVNLDKDNNPRSVLDMGVRIYSDGRNPKDKSSLATQRRIPRGARRRRDRYLERRDHLMGALIAYGLMPLDEGERKEIERVDPYQVRARALDHALTPHELGRALFHLNQRRGFKSNRKAAGGDETEKTKTKAEMAELRRRIEESDSRTLGEYLNRRHQGGRPVRFRNGLGLYPDRALYETEFHSIRAAQQPHQSLSDYQWERLEETIFHQRPLRPVQPGFCLFEEGELRAPKALPASQEFRMVQEVNNLRVQPSYNEPERPLADDERIMALDYLRNHAKLTFRRMATLLDLPGESKFNMETEGRSDLKGDETSVRLANRNLFGSMWRTLDFDERTKRVRFLLDSEDPEEVIHSALNEWGLGEAEAERVSEANLPSGHVHLSEKAIAKILPLMSNQGLLYWEAVQRHPDYRSHSDFRPDNSLDVLPYYGAVLRQEVAGAADNPPKGDDAALYGRISNPTVHIGLNQVRRVVNTLIDKYGKPEHIVVELARDLKSSRDQINQRVRANRDGAERNTRLRGLIENAELQPTAPTLRKLRLWEEQGPEPQRVCPYTGAALSFEMVVSAQTEIDHILPVSQTLDDSPANMVVCTVKANRDKGDRGPYDAFGHNPAGYDYDDILERASYLPWNKRWRFQPDAMERLEQRGDFLDRQLHETMWLSVAARKYLAHLFDEKRDNRNRVDATPGRLTAALRRGWGLENMLLDDADKTEDRPLTKQRDDHRHHAIDAFVVACTSRSLLQSISRAAAVNADEQIAKIAQDTPPWAGFNRDQVRPYLDRLVVSHKPDHGTAGAKGSTSGQLHDATAFGLIGTVPDLDQDVKGPQIGRTDIVIRKKLDTFSRPKLKDVRDQQMRSALTELWDSVAARTGKPSGNSAEFAKEAWDPGVKLGDQLIKVRSVRVTEANARVIVVKDRKGIPYKAYKPNSNEYADLWEFPPWPYKLEAGVRRPRGVQNGDRPWVLVALTAFEANQQNINKRNSRPHPAAKRIARLHINDMCALGTGTNTKIFRVRKIDSSGIVHIDPHTEANVSARIGKGEMKGVQKSAEQLRKEGFRKIGVNEIGDVLDHGPRVAALRRRPETTSHT